MQALINIKNKIIILSIQKAGCSIKIYLIVGMKKKKLSTKDYMIN
jgi:hypothetical protein